MFKSAAIDDRRHSYVYFGTNLLSVTLVERNNTVVLSAKTQGNSIGVVIDKAINGPGGTDAAA